MLANLGQSLSYRNRGLSFLSGVLYNFLKDSESTKNHFGAAALAWYQNQIIGFRLGSFLLAAERRRYRIKSFTYQAIK
jgi:hypothetical protein